MLLVALFSIVIPLGLVIELAGNWIRAPPIEYHAGTREVPVTVRSLLAARSLTAWSTRFRRNGW